MGGIRPLDEEFLKNMLRRNFKAWITLEEHGRIGGLGSTILEWLNDNNLESKITLKRVGTPLEFINELGNQQYTRQKLGIDSKGIVKKVLDMIRLGLDFDNTLITYDQLFYKVALEKKH